MAAAPQNIDAFHHHALVHADRLEPGRLPDHGSAPEGTSGFDQCPGACHRRFFVARDQNQQWLFERLIKQRTHSLDHQRKKTFHVTTAKAYPAIVDFRQLQWIGLPQRFVVGHGVAMPRQYQPAGAAAKAGEQIELARIDLLDIAVETQLGEPGRQQVDHPSIGLIQMGLGATDRRGADQGSELLFHGR